MSTPRRFFVSPIEYPETTSVKIDGEEFVHAKTVLRVTEGSEITLLDGSGNEYSAIVSKIEKHALSAHITGVNRGERDPKAEIYLLCGALKGDKTEFVVQKATELGVSRIGVFRSENCAAYMNENKLERLNKVARAAAKQCLRSVAPTVEFYDNFKEALASADGYENKFFACEFAERSEASFEGAFGSCAAVVGSEGGFTEEEFALSKEYGFKGMTLGKRILRAETAAVAVLALIAYFCGELK